MSKTDTEYNNVIKKEGCPQAALFFDASALSLIIWDALRFGRSGVLGRERQNDQGDDVGQHIVHRTWDIQRNEEREAEVHVRQRAERAEEQRRQRDARRLPLAENHDRQREEAETGDAVFKLPLGHAREDVADAAKPAVDAGNQHTRPAHFQHVDAHAVRQTSHTGKHLPLLKLGGGDPENDLVAKLHIKRFFAVKINV